MFGTGRTSLHLGSPRNRGIDRAVAREKLWIALGSLRDSSPAAEADARWSSLGRLESADRSMTSVSGGPLDQRRGNNLLGPSDFPKAISVSDDCSQNS